MSLWQLILYCMVLAPCIESFSIARSGDYLPLDQAELERLEQIVGSHINENPHDETGIALLKKIKKILETHKRE